MDLGVVPEILRLPLANTIVNLAKMNIDPYSMDWLDPPDINAVNNAVKELVHFGAINSLDNLKLTVLGDFICQTQLTPGCAKMIFESCTKGMGEAAIKLASIIQVSDLFFWRVASTDTEKKAKADDRKTLFASEYGDLVTMYNIYNKLFKLSFFE
jgi:HrpA-like RNA helicase